jgi:hypothetical protein
VFFYLGGQYLYITGKYTDNAHRAKHTQQHWFRNKLYTLVGFEPGSYAPEADAMSTAPRRRQGRNNPFLHYREQAGWPDEFVKNASKM